MKAELIPPEGYGQTFTATELDAYVKAERTLIHQAHGGNADPLYVFWREKRYLNLTRADDRNPRPQKDK